MYTHVVIISVEQGDARKVCERIQGDIIDDFDNHHDISEVDPTHYEVYSISDYMDLVNDQVLDNLTSSFVTFINCK